MNKKLEAIRTLESFYWNDCESEEFQPCSNCKEPCEDGQKIFVAIEALKKQIPKKPKYYKIGIWKYAECPNGCIEFGYNKPNYCEQCGQMIDWSDK